jgi:hypothetical protein
MVYGEKNGKLLEVESSHSSLVLLNNEQDFLDEPIEITSINKIVPFMISEDGGAFLLYSCNETLGKGLLYVEQGNAYFTAPSFLDHLDDLIIGLQSEIYTLGEELINYPFLWHERMQVHSGIKVMNEFGEVE